MRRFSGDASCSGRIRWDLARDRGRINIHGVDGERVEGLRSRSKDSSVAAGRVVVVVVPLSRTMRAAPRVAARIPSRRPPANEEGWINRGEECPRAAAALVLARDSFVFSCWLSLEGRDNATK